MQGRDDNKPHRVLLCDIDGTLLIKVKDEHGKEKHILNPTILAKMEDYDEVYLFTQRDKYVLNYKLERELGKLKESASIEDIERSQISYILDELRTRFPNKEIKVSTTLDEYFYDGEVGKYFEQEVAAYGDKITAAVKNMVLEGEEIPSTLKAEAVDEINRAMQHPAMQKRYFETLLPNLNPQNYTKFPKYKNCLKKLQQDLLLGSSLKERNPQLNDLMDAFVKNKIAHLNNDQKAIDQFISVIEALKSNELVDADIAGSDPKYREAMYECLIYFQAQGRLDLLGPTFADLLESNIFDEVIQGKIDQYDYLSRKIKEQHPNAEFTIFEDSLENVLEIDRCDFGDRQPTTVIVNWGSGYEKDDLLPLTEVELTQRIAARKAIISDKAERERVAESFLLEIKSHTLKPSQLALGESFDAVMAVLTSDAYVKELEVGQGLMGGVRVGFNSKKYELSESLSNITRVLSAAEEKIKEIAQLTRIEKGTTILGKTVNTALQGASLENRKNIFYLDIKYEALCEIHKISKNFLEKAVGDQLGGAGFSRVGFSGLSFEEKARKILAGNFPEEYKLHAQLFLMSNPLVKAGEYKNTGIDFVGMKKEAAALRENFNIDAKLNVLINQRNQLYQDKTRETREAVKSIDKRGNIDSIAKAKLAHIQNKLLVLKDEEMLELQSKIRALNVSIITYSLDDLKKDLEDVNLSRPNVLLGLQEILEKFDLKALIAYRAKLYNDALSDLIKESKSDNYHYDEEFIQAKNALLIDPFFDAIQKQIQIQAKKQNKNVPIFEVEKRASSTANISDTLKATPIPESLNMQKIGDILEDALATNVETRGQFNQFVRAIDNFKLDELLALRDQFYDRVMDPHKAKYGSDYRKENGYIREENQLLMDDQFAALQHKIENKGGVAIKPMARSTPVPEPAPTQTRGRALLASAKGFLVRRRSQSPETKKIVKEGLDIFIPPDTKRPGPGGRKK